MVKPDWDIFKSKFSDNPQWYFEWFCYLLFCREHKKPYGIERYKNQAGIEMQPIECNDCIVGMQAKFYDSTLSNHKDTLIKMLEKINEKYPKLNKLYFYSNQEWGQGRSGNKSQVELEIESLANTFNIEIAWKLTSFFESEFVSLKNKDISNYFFSPANKENIYERVEILNKEYQREFQPLNGGIIKRSEEAECISVINCGNSFILHGKAGRGKSGITINLISYLKENDIPYLAIKLDKRVPKHNSNVWSKNLGLPCNIAECVDYISKDTKGVLILDQLDALRWTQAHSRVALDVCYEIINKIKFINTIRANNISIVFVCRTYDLINDNSIKNLFETHDGKEKEQWKRIQVNELSDDDAHNIIGKEYQNLNIKTKSVLKILSNIFIWQQIKGAANFADLNECTSTFKLIEKWWQQIKENGVILGLQENILEQNKNIIVNAFEKSNRLEISKRRLNGDDRIIKFLISQNFIVGSDDKISFAHQSILDCLFAKKMEEDYLEGLTVEEIIGNNQTPMRRFQLQLLIQMLFEEDTKDFINFGEKLINSSKIRYSFKFVFYEMLNQIEISDNNINKFVLQNCEDEIILINVLLNNKTFIRLFMQNGILDKWINDAKKIDLVLIMLCILSIKFIDNDIDFIEKHLDIIGLEEDRFDRIFWRDTSKDSDRLFELRMQIYNKHPDKVTKFDFDINQTFIKSQKRVVRLLKFLLQNKTEKTYRDFMTDENCLNTKQQIIIEDPIYVITELIEIIPVSGEGASIYYSSWSNYTFSNQNLERSVMELLKLATKNLAENKPDLFFDLFKKYLGIGSYLHNEIILFALQYISNSDSDRVINYICSDFEKNALDYTSDTDNKLAYTKKIISKHSQNCTNEVFTKLEKFIYYYKQFDIYENAKRRYNFRKSDGQMVTWSYYGDLQYELLKELDPSRINKKSVDYIKVLSRKFVNPTKYSKSKFEGAKWITSSIHNKKLSDNQWIQILSNNKISNNRSSNRDEDCDYSVENSLYQIGTVFQNCVSAEPQRFIELYQKHYINIRAEYTPCLLNGIAADKNAKKISLEDLEKIINVCSAPYLEENYSAILNIISANCENKWSSLIIDLILNISVKNTEEFEMFKFTSNDDNTIDNISMRSLNHVKAKAISTLAEILIVQTTLFEKFKNVVNHNINDKDVAIRYSVFELLKTMYDLDPEYATPHIIKLFTNDILTTGAYNADYLIYCLSKTNDLKSIILAMYSSQHKQLFEKGTRLIVELFLLDNSFEDIVMNFNNIENDKKEIVVKTLFMNFDNLKYNSKCKEILTIYKDNGLEFEISELFDNQKIDLIRDRDFLLSMKCTGRYTLKSFKKYLAIKALSVIDYNKIIIQLCEDYILKYNPNIDYENVLAGLLFGLYDEAKENCEYIQISNKCLDLIDLIFEKNVGNARSLSKQIMDR